MQRVVVVVHVGGAGGASAADSRSRLKDLVRPAESVGGIRYMSASVLNGSESRVRALKL